VNLQRIGALHVLLVYFDALHSCLGLSLALICRVFWLQKEEIQAIATGVFGTIDKHSSEFLPYSFAYVETEKVRNASKP
jgi:hypothetical protein